jgi:sodium/pantothenate symporter
MSPYALGLLLSIAVYLLVGNYAGRKVKHLEDYFVAGRNAPTLLIVGTLIASLISTNAFMGETGLAYSGYPAILIMLTLINCVGYVLGALFFGRYLRRSRALTVAEYFGRRFDSRRVQSAAGTTVALGCTAYLVVVTQGAATIVHEVTGFSFFATLALTWLGYTLFTMYSGSRGVVLTDTMMFLLFTAVVFMSLGFILQETGGWLTAVRELATHEAKPGILSWHGVNTPESTWKTPAESLTYSVILGLAWGIVVAVSPWQASRYLMARNEHTVIRSSAIAAAVIMLFYLALMFAASAINLINPAIEPAQENMIWTALNRMPTVLGVLLVSGILAAALSSASTFLSLVGFSVSNDIRPPRATTDGKRLSDSRKAMLMISLAALALAAAVPQGKLFWITYFAGTLFASSWGPVAFMSVWSRRITEAAAFWGIIAGLLGNLLTNALALLRLVDLPVFLDPILVGAIISYLTIEAVSYGGRVGQKEHAWRERLHRVPAAEIDFAKLSRTLAWSAAVMISGVLMTVLMVVFYYLPYRAAVQDRATGELVLSVAVGLAVFLAGLFAWIGARSAYES